MSGSVIAIYFTHPGDNDPPFHKDLYRIAYRTLHDRLKAKDVRLVVVRGSSSYLGKNNFSHYWIFDGDTVKRINETITANLIFNKQEDDCDTIHFDSEARLLNVPALHEICRKHNTYSMFPEFSPKSVIIKNSSELEGAIAKIGSERFVMKPTDAGAGRSVFVATKNSIPDTIEYPAVVQEFLDTSEGIPGITDTTHDLRYIFIGGDIRLCYVRIPAPGLLTANYALGGRKIFIENPEQNTPSEALAIAHAIDAKLSAYKSRFYTIDLGLDKKKGWKIFELNSPPGMFPVDGNELIDRYMNDVVDHFIYAARGCFSDLPLNK